MNTIGVDIDCDPDGDSDREHLSIYPKVPVGAGDPRDKDAEYPKSHHSWYR